MMVSSDYFVSIIIPVYNDLEKLQTCLKALESQTYPKELYEVIVVDNCSTENIKLTVFQFDDITKYAFEDRPGSYAARNKGLSIAKGKILGFTDADCIPARDWIEKAVQRLLEQPDYRYIAGRINFFFKDPGHPTSAEFFDSQTFLNQQKYIEKEHYGATANLFTLREVFDEVGFFNSQLKSGGDREWGKRVYAAGYKQIYADDVCISHPARHSLKLLKSKVCRVVEGQYSRVSDADISLTSAIIQFFRDAKPYLGYAINVFKNEEIPNLGYKLALIRIHIILRYARARTKFRLNIQ